jgi:hypothetical protein
MNGVQCRMNVELLQITWTLCYKEHHVLVTIEFMHSSFAWATSVDFDTVSAL